MHLVPESSAGGGVYSVANLLAEKQKAMTSNEFVAKYGRDVLDWQRLGATLAFQQKLAVFQQGEKLWSLRLYSGSGSEKPNKSLTLYFKHLDSWSMTKLYPNRWEAAKVIVRSTATTFW